MVVVVVLRAWLPWQIALEVNTGMVDLTMVCNVRGVDKERHDMNAEEEAAKNTTTLENRELDGMHCKGREAGRCNVAVVPFVYVLVDELLVQEAMREVGPDINPKKDQDEPSDEMPPAMFVDIVVQLEVPHSIDVSVENACAQNASPSCIKHTPHDFFTVMLRREKSIGLAFPLCRALLHAGVIKLPFDVVARPEVHAGGEQARTQSKGNEVCGIVHWRQFKFIQQVYPVHDPAHQEAGSGSATKQGKENEVDVLDAKVALVNFSFAVPKEATFAGIQPRVYSRNDTRKIMRVHVFFGLETQSGMFDVRRELRMCWAKHYSHQLQRSGCVRAEIERLHAEA